MLTIVALLVSPPCPTVPPQEYALVDLNPRIGPRTHHYRWELQWHSIEGELEATTTGGDVCVDARGRVYVNTDGPHPVIVLDEEANVLERWGPEWRGGIRGMTLVSEGKHQSLYIALPDRHTVARTTLDGETLGTLPSPARFDEYERPEDYRPTSVAVAKDGQTFVADGFGRDVVHRYSKDREYLGWFGGKGDLPGQFDRPVGLVVETVGEAQYVLVIDRDNHRLQRFDLDGRLLRVETPGLRRPCSAVFTKDVRGNTILAVTELEGRVTLLGLDDAGERVVLARLGENTNEEARGREDVPRSAWEDGEFLAPFGIGADAAGNLYVSDWNRPGRLTKLTVLAR